MTIRTIHLDYLCLPKILSESKPYTKQSRLKRLVEQQRQNSIRQRLLRSNKYLSKVDKQTCKSPTKSIQITNLKRKKIIQTLIKKKLSIIIWTNHLRKLLASCKKLKRLARRFSKPSKPLSRLRIFYRVVGHRQGHKHSLIFNLGLATLKT